MERIDLSLVDILEKIYERKKIAKLYKVIHKESKEIMCMKKIFIKNLPHFQDEGIAMVKLNHPNIISLKSVAHVYKKEIMTYIIFMDFFEEGDLGKLICKRKTEINPWTEIQLLDFLNQLVLAYAFMQRQNIAHRDIKPQNILVSNNGTQLKVADLGSAKKNFFYVQHSLVGTPLYLSPLLNKAYNLPNFSENKIDHDIFKSDVYSLGLTFLFMASLKDIRNLSNLNNLQNNINARLDEIRERYPFFTDLLRKMLAVDENDRVDFIQLEKILKKSNSKIEINEANLSGIQFAQIEKLFGKCEVCSNSFEESELFMLTSGLLCKKCFSDGEKLLIPNKP